ncbi:MAG: amidohydrolase family protein, partial [Chloroflexi bacterium]|nr:amidohydrolase family protein [Chloroflexota bacterium]
MSRLLITNSRIWQADRFLDGHSLLIEGGRISAISRAGEVAPLPGDRRLDADDCYALPGFVDLHLHGSDGCDVMDAKPESLRNLGAFLLRQGLTSCLGTTMADTPERISRALEVMREYIKTERGPFIGAHLEGPYLNAAYRGSQPAQHLRSPDPAEYRPWLDCGIIKLITLAPELAGGADLLAEAVARGIHVSIGHSAADYAAAGEFFRAGISQVTHTFNGMPGLHH